MSSLVLHAQQLLPNPSFHRLYTNVQKDSAEELVNTPICLYLRLATKCLVLCLPPCSERCDHEAHVEIRGQDEMSEEAFHVPLPGLPHHLPALLQPLHGRWIRAGEAAET